MSRLPRLTGRQLIEALSKAGFEVVRVRGSHHRLRHADGRRTVIPVHGSEVLGVGLLSSILADCEISSEELLELLR